MLNTMSSEQVETKVAERPIGSPTEFSRMKAWLDERIAKGKKEPHAEVVTLTPVLASLLLERNPVNRPVIKNNKAVLAEDIANGRFMFNGESIVISNTGILIDGQHRCATVIETGLGIQVVMVFGPREDARYTIDIGSPKTAANFLHMKGKKDTKNLAATISLILMYRSSGMLTPGGLHRPTKTAVFQSVEQLRGVEASLGFVGDVYKKRPGSKAVLAFCHWIFARKAGRDAADEFMRGVADGEGLRKGDPIYYCREKLAQMPGGITANTRAELIVRCWNAWRLGNRINSTRLLGGKLPKVEG